MRLDVYLFEHGICESRSAAQALISRGGVIVNGTPAVKNSFNVEESDSVSVVESLLPKFVGRGGEKLSFALESFGIKLHGKTCVDVGASTGGFTDCMLQNGAAKVFAVDVGTSQLSEKLRQDKRVISLEQTDIRDFSDDNDSVADFVSADVSFISLKLVLPHILKILKDDGEAVCLIKPQFEAGRQFLSKKGIVTSEKVRTRVTEEIKTFAEGIGLISEGIVKSPITGGDGNTEFLIHLKNSRKIN